MSHSTHEGLRLPLSVVCRWITRPSRAFSETFSQLLAEPSLWSPLVGVGHDPNPISPVRGTNGASWYAVPFRIVPERGQVSENSSKSPSKQSCDVLHDDVAGSYLANNSGEL
jgi:hypothetical protein